jgi:hypothetical protein
MPYEHIVYEVDVKEKGLAGAFRERDAKFGDGRARVEGPELCFERGFLIGPSK